MIEMYLKYDNMHIFGMINAFICINNHVNSCINSMLSWIYDIIIIINLNESVCRVVVLVHELHNDDRAQAVAVPLQLLSTCQLHDVFEVSC